MASFYPYAKFVVGIRGGCNFGYFNSLSEAMACGGPRTAGFESAKILGRFPTHMQPFGQTSAANAGALAPRVDQRGHSGVFYARHKFKKPITTRNKHVDSCR